MIAVGDEAQSIVLAGTPLTEGTAVGPLQRLDESLSFWGGVDAHGRICDVHHPQRGTLLGGTVLLMPSGRGSSSSAAVLAEQIRAGTAPAAIVLRELDGILVAGALVAAELYDVRVPVLTLPAQNFDRLASASSTDRATQGTVAARVEADDRSATVTFQGA